MAVSNNRSSMFGLVAKGALLSALASAPAVAQTAATTVGVVVVSAER